MSFADLSNVNKILFGICLTGVVASIYASIKLFMGISDITISEIGGIMFLIAAFVFIHEVGHVCDGGGFK